MFFWGWKPFVLLKVQGQNMVEASSATSLSKQKSDESVSDGIDRALKLRAMNFILFNFIIPIQNSNHDIAKHIIKSGSTGKSFVNDLMSNLKDGKYDDNGCKKHDQLIETLTSWRKVDNVAFDKILSFFLIVYGAHDTHDCYMVMNLPLFILTKARFYHDLDDGPISLFKELICSLSIDIDCEVKNDSCDIRSINIAINTLFALAQRLDKFSYKVDEFVKPGQVLKAKGLMIKLAFFVKKKHSLYKPICDEDKYIATSIAGIDFSRFNAKNNSVGKLQAVIDTIVQAEMIYGCDDSVDGKIKFEKFNNELCSLISNFAESCSDKAIIKSTIAIETLSKHKQFFVDYLMANTFNEISSQAWVQSYLRYCVERNYQFDFFCAMASAFIPRHEFNKELKRIKQAVEARVARDKSSKRTQLNVTVDKKLFDIINEFCENNKMQKSELVKLAVSEFINNSSR
ncbi:hypothetical protein C7R88_05860 [Plesiomonas shigelloides]|nr:hypothetical protein C7R88_05860 [Plesiomonas shigelloides]